MRINGLFIVNLESDKIGEGSVNSSEKYGVNAFQESEKHATRQGSEKVGKVNILHEKPGGRRSVSFFMTEFFQ